MESASFQPRPPQQLRALTLWLEGLVGGFCSPERGEVCEGPGRAHGDDLVGPRLPWHYHQTLSRHLFPRCAPVIQPRPPICSGTSPPMLFSAPKGAQAPPCSPWEWNWGCSHHPAPGCSCCLGFPREVLLILGSPISTSPQSSPGPAGDLVGLCWASPALIQALNQADKGCCRVGGHQQPPPCSLSILGGMGPARFPPPPPDHFIIYGQLINKLAVP